MARDPANHKQRSIHRSYALAKPLGSLEWVKPGPVDPAAGHSLIATDVTVGLFLNKHVRAMIPTLSRPLSIPRSAHPRGEVAYPDEPKTQKTFKSLSDPLGTGTKQDCYLKATPVVLIGPRLFDSVCVLGRKRV